MYFISTIKRKFSNIYVQKTEFITKMVKFGLVGLSGVFVDYFVTFSMKEIFLINKYIANTSGFITAASTNYLLNRRWTFKSTNPAIVKEYLKFFGISLAGLLLNNFIIWLLTDYALSIHFYLSKFIAILVVFIWNFFMNHYFNFH